jgi:hypothetical protein
LITCTIYIQKPRKTEYYCDSSLLFWTTFWFPSWTFLLRLFVILISQGAYHWPYRGGDRHWHDIRLQSIEGELCVSRLLKTAFYSAKSRDVSILKCWHCFTSTRDDNSWPYEIRILSPFQTEKAANLCCFDRAVVEICGANILNSLVWRRECNFMLHLRWHIWCGAVTVFLATVSFPLPLLSMRVYFTVLYCTVLCFCTILKCCTFLYSALLYCHTSLLYIDVL